VEALKRSGLRLTREALVQALEKMNDYDAGGYALKFGPGRHHGAHHVDITLIGSGARIID
jgi:branched-chain amino acid transport system substrate-binding protein